MAWDLKATNVTSIAVSPGYLRSEDMLRHFGVTEETWRDVLSGVAGWRLAELPVSVRSGDDTWGAGGDEVTVPPYELFRALFSRRSRAQVRAWAGPVPTDEQLDAIPVFGPRDDDQPQP